MKFSKILHKDYCSILKLANIFLPKTARYQRWDPFIGKHFPRKPVEHTNGKYTMGVELVRLLKWGKFLF